MPILYKKGWVSDSFNPKYIEQMVVARWVAFSIKSWYNHILQQAEILTAMDYYEYMMILSCLMILVIFLFPALNNRYKKWREITVSPA